MGNAKQITRVYVQDGSFQQSSTPPEITNLGATAIPRGALFIWDRAANIYPNWYEVSTKVAGGAWSTYTRHDVGYFVRYLTDAEITSYGRVPTMYIKVRTTNIGGTYGTEVNTSVDALHLDVADADVDYGGGVDLTASVLDSTVTARMFTTSAKLSDEISVTAQTNKFVTANEKTGAGYAYTFLDATGLAPTAQVDDVLASTVADYAAEGHTAYTKVNSEAGANTIETTAGSQAKVDARVSSTEKTNLQTAIGTTLAGLSSDTILVSGTHGNISGTVKTAVRTSLDITNVENKSSATIRGEIVDANLSATTAILAAVPIAAINASAEATKIAKAQIATVKASSIQQDAAAVALFNAAGDILDATVVGTGSGKTASDVAASTSAAGTSIQLDLTSIAAGNLDNIADGATYEKTTVNEVLGAGRAFTALDATNRLTTSIYDGATAVTVANLVTAYGMRKSIDVLWSYVTVNSEVETDNDITCTGTGAGIINAVGLAFIPFIKNNTGNTLTFRAYFANSDLLGTLHMRVMSEAGAAVVGFSDVALGAATGLYEVSCAITGLTTGTRYFAQVVVDGTNLSTYVANSPILWIEA